MKELGDDEIRVIGDSPFKEPKKPNRLWALLALVAMIVLIAFLVLLVTKCGDDEKEAPTYFDTVELDTTANASIISPQLDDSDGMKGVTQMDTLVNDIPLTIYQPHGLRASLHIGELQDPEVDTTIVMALVAADIRADNGMIVSAFVLHGEPVSRGVAKQGYCAIIDGKITLGVDAETPLYERAIEREGDFFRQYPLVSNGRIVENKVKNKAQRRALAQIGGKVVVVTTGTRESLHDFAQSLVDIGAESAVNLVGSKMRTGWINLGDTTIVPEEKYGPLPANVNYIVWSK